VVSNIRTSHSYRFESKDDEFCTGILHRFSEITNEPIGNFERPTVIRYQREQFYKAHLDAFSKNKLSHRKHLDEAGQRMNTFILSLQRAEDGGETRFPSLGLSVSLGQGELLIFHNLDENKMPSFKILHESVAVRQGEKWIFTTWSRETPLAC
jgi:prolyl 4-hydroxylase